MRKSLVIAVTLGFVLSLHACGGGGGGGGGGSGSGMVYVRASGNDGNSGFSPNEALRTIEAGLNKAGRGDRIIVGPGRYIGRSGDIVVNLDGRGGSAGQPLEIIADVNGSRTGDVPGPVTVDATGRPFGFRFTTSRFVVIDGFTIINTAGANAAGVHVRTDSRDITIRNCEIANNDFDGVRIENSSDVLLLNNLIHQNAQRGVQLGSGSVNPRLINNTIAFNVNDGVSGSGGGSRNVFLRNNIVHQNGNRGIDVRDSATSGYDADYNLVFQRAGISVAYGPSTDPGPNDINGDAADPLLVNGFYLSQRTSGQNNDSPGINVGDPATNLQFLDLLLARTTKTNLEPDADPVDVGYHYPGRFEPPPTRTLPPGTTPPGMITPTSPPSSNLFVRASAGSDGNDGRAPSTALRTIQAAVDRAMAGNTIIVGPGTYRERVIFRTMGGDPSNPIRLTANPRGDLTGDSPGDVVIDADGLGRGVFIDAAQYIIVDGFRITNSSAGAPAIEIRRESVGAEVHNCEIFNNAEDGIRVQESDDVVIFNNLIYCNARRGLLIGGASGGSNRASVINNTIAQNGDRGVFVGNSDAASVGTFMRNNIIQNNAIAELQVVTQPRNSLDGFDADFNIVFDEPAQSGQYIGPTPGPNDLQTSAGFADVALCQPFELHDDDYRLSLGSPGINTADPATASRFTALLFERTTSIDDAPDAPPLDRGFHFER